MYTHWVPRRALAGPRVPSRALILTYFSRPLFCLEMYRLDSELRTREASDALLCVWSAPPPPFPAMRRGPPPRRYDPRSGRGPPRQEYQGRGHNNARNRGTEKDKIFCPFYVKTGACRHDCPGSTWLTRDAHPARAQHV